MMDASIVVYDYSDAVALDWNSADEFAFEPHLTADRCRSDLYVLLKRLVDVPVATLLLILLAPLMLVIAIMVRATSSGPAVFRQRRLGRVGREFDCFKFRSMRSDAEAVLRDCPLTFAQYVENDYKLPEDCDPRITTFGRFLRKSSLDELPQLFNVVRGDMSIVGPRPIVPAELAHYGRRADDFLAALPGITGKWQVGGRSKVAYPLRAEIELDYVYRWSPLSDVRILWRTVPAVLSRDGAY
jgi:lipopolysaccharide/colanic/teichoic acid biosynthesis glycosyltransferase